MCAYSVHYLTFLHTHTWLHTIAFQCSVCLSLKRINILQRTEFSFPLFHSSSASFSHSSLCRSVHFSLAQWVLLTWSLTCVTQAHSNRNWSLPINQVANLLSTSSFSLLLPFCLSYFPSFLSSICYWLFWSSRCWFSLRSNFSVFSLFCFSIIPLPLSVSLSGAWHALCLFNCHHGLGRIEEDEGEMGWGGHSRERYNEWEREKWQNLLIFLLSSLAVSPKGEDSKWVMGQFLVGPHITRALLCFNEPGSQDYSNWCGLRFQNSGNPFNGFC